MSSAQTDHEGISALFADLEGPVAKIVEHKAIAVESMAKVFVLIPGSGKLYEPGSYWWNHHGKLYHWVRTMPAHRASAPGQPPSSDSGFLLNHIHHEMVLVKGKVTGRVVANTKYAGYLEKGTSLMAPRPFLKPALHAGMAAK